MCFSNSLDSTLINQYTKLFFMKQYPRLYTLLHIILSLHLDFSCQIVWKDVSVPSNQRSEQKNSIQTGTEWTSCKLSVLTFVLLYTQHSRSLSLFFLHLCLSLSLFTPLSISFIFLFFMVSLLSAKILQPLKL